jgi:hypothetical protein
MRGHAAENDGQKRCGARAQRARLNRFPRINHRNAIPASLTPITKSFLVLFFKKELLPSSSTTQSLLVATGLLRKGSQ